MQTKNISLKILMLLAQLIIVVLAIFEGSKILNETGNYKWSIFCFGMVVSCFLSLASLFSKNSIFLLPAEQGKQFKFKALIIWPISGAVLCLLCMLIVGMLPKQIIFDAR